MIVDTHVHVYTDDTTTYPQKRDAPPGNQGQWSPCSAEQLLKLMDDAGVAYATLVQAYFVYQYDNRYAVNSANAYRKRFGSVVILDPLDPGSPDELSRLVETEGVMGLRLMRARLPVSSLDNPATFPLWDRIQKLKVPVSVNDRLADVSRIRKVIDRCPDVKIAFEHSFAMYDLGVAPYKSLDPLFAFADCPNVYLKLAINNVAAAEEGGGTGEMFFSRMVEMFGARRIMWCSNYPAHPGIGTYQDRVDVVRKALDFLSEEDREWIFAKTALSVYPSLRQ
jgi:L-fuconolactonase